MKKLFPKKIKFRVFFKMSNSNYFNNLNLNDALTFSTFTNANISPVNDQGKLNTISVNEQYDDYNTNKINLFYQNHSSKILNTNSNTINYNHVCSQENYMMNINNINIATAAAAQIAVAATTNHQNVSYHQPMFVSSPNNDVDPLESTQTLQNSASQAQNLVYPWMRNSGGNIFLSIVICFSIL